MTAAAKLLVGTVGLLVFSASFSQDIRDDEAEVLLTIERAWQAAQKGKYDDLDDMLADNFMGWDGASPAPRAKTSTSKWIRLGDRMGEIRQYELYPLSITVQDDVAVAHYLYSLAFETKDGKINLSSGRYTDVLVRSDDGWKYLAWHGGKAD